jgi:Domain of Unknown Function (DUF1206)
MTSSVVHGRSGSDRVAELAREHPSLVMLARVGWIAKGIVYGLVGVLAVPIAMSGIDSDQQANTDEEASQSGAELAEHSYGELALWLVGIGLGLYVLWRLVSLMLPASNSAKAWVTRAGYLVSVIVYSALAWSAISIARRTGAGGESEDGRVEQFTRDLMDMSGGRWIVGLIGAALIGIGAFFVYRGVTAEFRDELDGRPVGPIGHETIVRLGQAGWIGRGVMMLLVGWFVAQAAIDFNPEEAQGIDGALRDATSSTFGAFLAIVVAVGLVVYGAFCVISAPLQRLTNAD